MSVLLRLRKLLRDSLVSLIAKSVVRVKGKGYYLLLSRRSRNISGTQGRVLKRLLAGYARTEYGQSCHLDGNEDLELFKKRVPINDYEALRPWIQREMRDGGQVITPADPVAYYITSGTTGQSKFLPALAETLRWNRSAQMLGGWSILRDRPRMLDGKIVAIGSAACEKVSERGVRIGSKSGEVYQNLNSFIKSKYVVPASVFGVADYSVKYLLILRLALNCRDITYIQTANTSTLVLLSDMLNEHWEDLVEDVERGGFHCWKDLEPEVWNDVQGRLPACPARAWELRRIALLKKNLGGAGVKARIRLGDVFPDIQAVGCWISGSCGIFLKRLCEELPRDTLVRDIGYIASELHGTVPLDGNGQAALPLFDHVFFEFVPKANWENGDRVTLGLDQLTDREQYYIIVTTADGLLRYAMNDIVQVEGYFKQVPRLRFVQKGEGMTNITGEKISEFQLLEGVSRFERDFDLCSTFFYMLAEEMNSRYHLYYELPDNADSSGTEVLENYAAALDAHLAELNIEYASKRKSGRLNPLVISLVKKGTLRNFKKHWVKTGRREGQFKIIALRYAREVSFDFESHAVTSSEGGEQMQYSSDSLQSHSQIPLMEVSKNEFF